MSHRWRTQWPPGGPQPLSYGLWVAKTGCPSCFVSTWPWIHLHLSQLTCLYFSIYHFTPERSLLFSLFFFFLKKRFFFSSEVCYRRWVPVLQVLFPWFSHSGQTLGVVRTQGPFSPGFFFSGLFSALCQVTGRWSLPWKEARCFCFVCF